MVSIIVLTRNGAPHLERLLAGLQRTTYRSFEVVVVDNDSDDATSLVLGEERGFPLRVIRNEHNASFSVGNNQAAAEGVGEFLLLLNNDVEPISQGWLGSMVDVLEAEPDAVACGAVLIYPVRGDNQTDLTVQHAGTRFTFMSRGVRAINIINPDPLDEANSGLIDVPAATAAALLVDRTAFDEVGGLTEGYVYGTEDVDLCLKLLERGGRVLVTGEAVLFHHESATQRTLEPVTTRQKRDRNRQLLMETWGPRLTRSVQRDRLVGGWWWSSERSRTVAITLTHDDISKGWGDYYTAHELGDAFSRDGWSVVYAERFDEHWYDMSGEIDLVISLLDSFDVRRAPEGAVTIAWVRNWVDRWLQRPWFESFDIVTTSSHAASEILGLRSRFNAPVIPLATNLTHFSQGPASSYFECDYAFTGNNWGEEREVLSLLDPQPGERFLLFGKGWDDSEAEPYWGGHLDYAQLPDLYRSAKIVLDDTASPTLPYAFVNGRVFDALASGALVISDNIEGSAEMFDGLLPTYRNGTELRAQLDHFLGNEADRTELAKRLRERVAANHNFSNRPAQFARLARDYVERPKAAIKVGATSEALRHGGEDQLLADALASGLTKRGIPTSLQAHPEWDLPQNQAVDLVLHIRGPFRYTPKPAHLNVLWITNNPDDVSAGECDEYDLVLVASSRHADVLRSQTATPIVFLPQATDERVFHPVDTSSELATQVLFVGDNRGVEGSALEWSLERGLPVHVHGAGWQGRLPIRYLLGDDLIRDRFAELYGSAKIVVCDHPPALRQLGFVSGRVYDALAAGAVVVSDRVEGIEDVFGDLVSTYSSPEELEELVRRLLEDDVRRGELSRAGAELVLGQHTFSHRAEELIRLVSPLLAERPKDVEGSRFRLPLR